MADLRNHDPLVEAVAKARKEASRRPDLKFPTGNLNIIGGHCYGYSGYFNTTGGSETTVLEFSTTSDYIVARVQLFVLDNNLGQDDGYGLHILFNNTTVIDGRVDDRSTPRSRQEFNDFRLVIPPFTRVTINAYADSTETDLGTVSLTGTVHQ